MGFVIAVLVVFANLYVFNLAVYHVKGDFGGQVIAVRRNRFLQRILAVRNLVQLDCLVAGYPCDFLGAFLVTRKLAVLGGDLGQVCAAGIGQLHACARQFLGALAILAHLDDGHAGSVILHDNAVAVVVLG